MKIKRKNSIGKQLGNTAARKKKAIVTRNAFRRALYHANKIIAAGSSFYPNKLSMKEFKKEYEKFGKRTNMLSSKKLENNLQTFVYNQIRNETPKQCETAADNLMKHLKVAVRALGQVKGNINSLSDNNQKYIKVLRATKAISEEPDKKDSSKIRYSLIQDKIPNKEDFIDVSNKYLRFKRLIIQEFGANEYGEAYGS